MRQLLSGAAAAFAFVAAVHFAKFHRRTGDSFHALFSAAFVMMAVNTALLGLTDPGEELRVALYGVRLVAFSLIIAAIVRKNRRSRSGRS